MSYRRGCSKPFDKILNDDSDSVLWCHERNGGQYVVQLNLEPLWRLLRTVHGCHTIQDLSQGDSTFRHQGCGGYFASNDLHSSTDRFLDGASFGTSGLYANSARPLRMSVRCFLCNCSPIGPPVMIILLNGPTRDCKTVLLSSSGKSSLCPSRWSMTLCTRRFGGGPTPGDKHL